MNHAENKNIWSKMKEKLHKYSFLGCLLLAGIVFFTWTDNWQVYTEPLQETYTKGVLLAEQLVEGKWPGISGEQSDATGSVSGNVPGENVKTGDTVSDGNQTDQTMGTVQSPATGEEAAMPEEQRRRIPPRRFLWKRYRRKWSITRWMTVILMMRYLSGIPGR